MMVDSDPGQEKVWSRNLLPLSDDTYNLGESATTYRWNKAYIREVYTNFISADDGELDIGGHLTATGTLTGSILVSEGNSGSIEINCGSTDRLISFNNSTPIEEGYLGIKTTGTFANDLVLSSRQNKDLVLDGKIVRIYANNKEIFNISDTVVKVYEDIVPFGLNLSLGSLSSPFAYLYTNNITDDAFSVKILNPQSLIPFTDNTYDLGSLNNRWNEAYFTTARVSDSSNPTLTIHNRDTSISVNDIFGKLDFRSSGNYFGTNSSGTSTGRIEMKQRWTNPYIRSEMDFYVVDQGPGNTYNALKLD
eukprot:Lithocolla_globosa_v1_NODE_24_length_9285_cov_66.491832.p2 type:complete len:306 gc:universal NODE_24_length_9285_cov_66.491832:4902-5819(+)